MLKVFSKELDADRKVAVWLAIWCIINILQATFTELANDEAYYHLYARHLSWGYFDHPPMVAFLVWLGEKVFSMTELGVRFFFTILQPLYLFLFWKTIKPQGCEKEDAKLFLMIVSSLLILLVHPIDQLCSVREVEPKSIQQSGCCCDDVRQFHS